jgi:hypothetical protein
MLKKSCASELRVVFAVETALGILAWFMRTRVAVGSIERTGSPAWACHGYSPVSRLT